MSYLKFSGDYESYEEFKLSSGEGITKVTFFPCNPVNILIGANNSRKSRFIRYLINQGDFLITSKFIPSLLKELKEAVDIFQFKDRAHIKVQTRAIQKKTIPLLGTISGYQESGLVTSNFNQYYLNNLYDNTVELYNTSFRERETIGDLYKKIQQSLFLVKSILYYPTIKERFPDQDYQTRQDINYYFSVEFKEVDEQKLYKKLSVLENVLSRFPKVESTSPSKIYIPTLRGAISLKSDNVTINPKIYENTIRNNYNLPEKLNVFTGLDLYDRIKKSRNSRKEERKKFDAFEDFLKINFFDNQEIDIVALEGESHIQLYVNNDDREMFNVGDGIQSLIILMYPIFTASNGEWIFIEEPELNMHPGLQTLFLKTITENEVITKKNLKIFITTHSNHLLNLTLREQEKASILSFQKIGDGDDNYTLIRQLFGPDMRVLDTLGVENSSVFLSNCTLWIEGVSDRRYIKAFLTAYMRDKDLPEFQEDLHFSFFEYAGSNLSHYLFSDEGDDEIEKIKAHFLSNRIYLLADKDSGKDHKHKAFEKMNNDYFQYSHTGVIEVENLLSASILKLILKDLFDVNNSFRFDESNYEEVGLGKFISEKLKGKVDKVPALRKDKKSETLTTFYKNKFSNYVLSKVKEGEITWTMIAENSSAKTITKNIYNFISMHNKKEK